MAIGDWQPGKIVVLWVVTLACYPVLRAAMPSGFSGDYSPAAHLIVWFIVVIGAAAITWAWLEEREGKPK